MRRRGFTLAEVVIGLVLMAGVFFALATIFPPSLAGLTKARHNVAATNLARHWMEVWKQTDFGTLILTTTPQTLPTQTIDGEQYTIIVVVGDTDPPDPQWIKTIDVSVVSSEDGPGACAAHLTSCVYNFKNPW